MVSGAGADEVIRVLIADDQAVFRRGLDAVLGAEEDIQVVAEAEDGEAAIARAAEVAPDVVLMDVRMPRVNGIEATRRIRELLPSTRILMLTVSDEEDDLYEAIKSGSERLPAQGHLGRGGSRRHPRRGPRPQPDLTVDGVQAAQ